MAGGLLVILTIFSKTKFSRLQAVTLCGNILETVPDGIVITDH